MYHPHRSARCPEPRPLGFRANGIWTGHHTSIHLKYAPWLFSIGDPSHPLLGHPAGRDSRSLPHQEKPLRLGDANRYYDTLTVLAINYALLAGLIVLEGDLDTCQEEPGGVPNEPRASWEVFKEREVRI